MSVLTTRARDVCLLVLMTACASDDESILVDIQIGDIQVPADADSLCLGISDLDAQGGHFGRHYSLVDTEGGSVGTLAVEPGNAQDALAVARVHRHGIEISSAQSAFDFSEDVAITLARCAPGRPNPPSKRDSKPVDAGSIMAVSQGGRGPWIVTVSEGDGQVWRAGAAGLEVQAIAGPQGQSAVLAALAFDVDADCDDDLLLLEATGPTLWQRQQTGFVESSSALPTDGFVAVAAIALDFNHDLQIDVALVGATGLQVWQAGDGSFEQVIDAAGAADLSDATALTAADLDGDNELDLVVARSGLSGNGDRILYGDGTGRFELDANALPELLDQSQGVAIADLNRDGTDEIIISVEGKKAQAFAQDAPRRYLEQTFTLLPFDPVSAEGLTVGDWNGDCEADLLIPAGDRTELWTSISGGLIEEEFISPATQVILVDLVGDGERDALLLGSTGLHWWKR